ncbi:GYD domain-containing protein [Thalassotalea psychrophila]|uniref:GYD domain-containing protein n=1 Tax=Thalassotalea psychrophila TaxID=3065647 RepID=A0ABY9TZH8_9GAMM|nr:GYD domain-containing protein [Colwelliaceae bacterium SQ149]
MKFNYKKLYAKAFIGVVLLFSVSSIAQEKADDRHFIFIAEPTAEGFKYLMQSDMNAGETALKKAFEAVGGKLISYYYGLGDKKQYIIVRLPNDDELIQAIYLMRLPLGVLESYSAVEIMPRDKMTKAIAKANAMISNDKTLKH